ncbi:MAG: TadE/TadG family type IV pilus assembly protein [Rickettsiales bacterium]
MLHRLVKRITGNEHGAALIEFAMVFPFFFILIFGGIEISRLILIQQKLEKSGYVLADIVTQYDPATSAAAAGEISEAELTNNVFPQLTRIMAPYQDPTRQNAIITSVDKNGSALTVRWQRSGGGTLTGCDAMSPRNCVRSIVNNRTPVGTATTYDNTPASFPATETTAIASYTPTGTGNFIVAETFYRYQPILQSLLQGVGTAGGPGFAGFRYYIPPRIYVKRTYFIPRKGPLPVLYVPPSPPPVPVPCCAPPPPPPPCCPPPAPPYVPPPPSPPPPPSGL